MAMSDAAKLCTTCSGAMRITEDAAGNLWMNSITFLGVMVCPERERYGMSTSLRYNVEVGRMAVTWDCKGNLTIEHNTRILARGIQSILDKYNTAEGCIPCKGIQRENSKDSPSEGGLHKEQSA